MIKTILMTTLGLVISASARAEIVEFHIGAGTVEKPWNTQATAIRAKVGDTLRIFNDDSVNHRLHTYGSPCTHGPDMTPGGSSDCVATQPFSSSATGPLYDHNYGEAAQVWIEVDGVSQSLFQNDHDE